jgi:hypothetical protein
MGQASKIKRTVFSPTIDASTMTARVMQFLPASEAEAFKLLRASFAECPLSMRVAALDMLIRGWPRNIDARHSPR